MVSHPQEKSHTPNTQLQGSTQFGLLVLNLVTQVSTPIAHLPLCSRNSKTCSSSEQLAIVLSTPVLKLRQPKVLISCRVWKRLEKVGGKEGKMRLGGKWLVIPSQDLGRRQIHVAP